ncbi:type IV secretion system protein VirB3 [Microvirga alba]|uniref:Type IV secretion system protein VirB3 n=1 Tax=Microvirga alba TaxID=2791025 RepID=A0A931BZD8_9HYPH|nr:type IV secretion system protein VirB3 [Microvirga alba]MBF9235607.1 type IV secretion system protein VirB3 [Microvirga alba]
MDDSLHEDPLFLACTRPAMIGGVTMEAVGVNVLFSCILFIAAGNIFYMAIGGVLHLICRALCKHDPNIFRVLNAWRETKARCLNRFYWGGSSVSPLKVHRRYNLKDFNLE